MVTQQYSWISSSYSLIFCHQVLFPPEMVTDHVQAHKVLEKSSNTMLSQAIQIYIFGGLEICPWSDTLSHLRCRKCSKNVFISQTCLGVKLQCLELYIVACHSTKSLIVLILLPLYILLLYLKWINQFLYGKDLVWISFIYLIWLILWYRTFGCT